MGEQLWSSLQNTWFRMRPNFLSSHTRIQQTSQVNENGLELVTEDEEDEPGTVLEEDDKNEFGEKSIDFWGGLALNINNITGPALVNIPMIYQEAGWFSPTLGFLVVMTISTFSATMLCEAMKLVPENALRHRDRIELTTLAKFHFSNWGYILTHILLFFSLTAANVAAIVQSSKTMDLALIDAFKWCGALEMYPHPGFRVETGESKIPFDQANIISIGYIIVLILTIPLGYFNLDDNINVQKGAALFLFLIIFEWFISFFLNGLHFEYLNAFSSNQTQVLGTVIFNYAFVTSIPSWANEKKDGVSINKTVWSASIISSVLFVLVGVLGALAYDLKGEENLLKVIDSHSTSGLLSRFSRIAVYLYPLAVLLTGIPVCSIIIRYNFLESQICGKVWANIWGVLLPWALALVFYQVINEVINWSSLLVNGVINFIIPLLLFIMAKKRASYEQSIHEVLSETNKIGMELKAIRNSQYESNGYESIEHQVESKYEAEDDDDDADERTRTLQEDDDRERNPLPPKESSVITESDFTALPPNKYITAENFAKILITSITILLVVMMVSDIILISLGYQVFNS